MSKNFSSMAYSLFHRLNTAISTFKHMHGEHPFLLQLFLTFASEFMCLHIKPSSCDFFLKIMLILLATTSCTVSVTQLSNPTYAVMTPGKNNCQLSIVDELMYICILLSMRFKPKFKQEWISQHKESIIV